MGRCVGDGPGPRHLQTESRQRPWRVPTGDRGTCRATSGATPGFRNPEEEERLHSRQKMHQDASKYSIWEALHVIVTTTPSVEGKRIEAYLGIVAGEAILGANIFRDVFAGIRDIVGGRSAAYERELEEARRIAMREMEERARDLGANAVVGVDIDYEVVGGTGSMLMVSASGTAVRLGDRPA